MSLSIATSGIVSQAFRLLEMQPISSFGDASEQAAAAREQYPVALDACLERADWSFASQPAALAMVMEPSRDPRFDFVYQRPSDLVAIREVHPCGAAWRLDRDRLRADTTGPLFIRYTARITDETRLPGNFRTAVAHMLAAQLAPRWTKSMNRKQGLMDACDHYIAAALTADRNQASARSYDDGPAGGDWAAEAVR